MALSFSFTLAFLVLNLPQVILISHLGSVAWYPATGLMLALLLGVSPWYGVLAIVCQTLAGSLIYHQSLIAASQTIGAVGTAGCYAGAAWVLRGPLKIDLGLSRRKDVVLYVFITMAAAVLSAMIGTSCLAADNAIAWHDFRPTAFSWLLGDEIGLLGVAPFLLIHVLPWVRKKLSAQSVEPASKLERRKRTRAEGAGAWLEGIAQAIALAGVLWVMFGPSLRVHQLFYLSFIPIIWIAMRQGIRRVVTGLLALNFGTVVAMQLFPPTAELLARLGLLMLVFSAVGLLVGSAVTERHRIGLELQEQTLYLNSLIENSPFGIVVLDRNGRLELTNPAFEKLFLYDQEELAGSDLDLLLSPNITAEDSVPLISLVLNGQALHETVRRKRKDGKILSLELHAVPLVVNGIVRGAYKIYQDISEQVEAARAQQSHAESLNRLVEELKLRTNQITLLNDMGSLLACCQTSPEAAAVVSQSVQKLFPTALAGTLYLFKASRNLVEAATRWGDPEGSSLVFSPQDCWGLRRGQPHWSVEHEGGISCPHLTADSKGQSLCIPLIGQGDTQGVLLLNFGDPTHAHAVTEPAGSPEATLQLAVTVVGQIALSLANLRLRETLRDQSIRDPLTGLFNRRFMEESLDRELQRATRKRHPVSVLFLDIDHFKKFNDNFGHDAGDLVLQSVAELFRNFFRADDVLCRYGGEEFAMILPESTSENAAMRANALREEVKRLRLHSNKQILDKISVSIGIATFPEHSVTSDGLLKVADQCLYESKNSGRDAVTVPGQTKPLAKETSSGAS